MNRINQQIDINAEMPANLLLVKMIEPNVVENKVAWGNPVYAAVLRLDFRKGLRDAIRRPSI